MGNIARHGLLTPPHPHNITSNALQNVPPSQITFSWQYVFASSPNENFDLITNLDRPAQNDFHIWLFCKWLDD